MNRRDTLDGLPIGDDPDIEAAVAGEFALLDPQVRQDRREVDRLLAPGFMEIGRSGRMWTREAMLDAIGTIHVDQCEPTAVSSMAGRHLVPDLVQLTYVSRRLTDRTWRTSLWARSETIWQLLYHQGTPVPA